MQIRETLENSYRTAIIEYESSPEIQEAIFNKILEYCKKHNSFSGESIMQDDKSIIDAPVVLSEIIDDIIKMKIAEYHYK